MKKSPGLHITTAVTAVIIAAILPISVSCSSQPKNPGDIVELRLLAEKELALANREAGRGNFETSHVLLKECKQRAILVDDTSLMIRCGLSLGNLLFSLGSADDAFAELEQAVALAEKYANRELLSVSKVYLARGRLVSGRVSAQSLVDEVNREAANIKSDKLYIAFSWQVKGLLLRELRSYREAEDAVKRSLDIHQKENFLENASYDWYLIASIRSLSGNTAGALQALELSIELDRRVENSWGLAANWRAMGDVHRKSGNTKEAIEAYQRSAAIFSAMGNEREAEETKKRIDQ